jgi:hypothetical protein
MFSSGGQFQAAWGGQFETAKLVTLQRPRVVNFSGFSNILSRPRKTLHILL